MEQPLPHAMFGLGVPELLIILAVVLLLFGGSRLAGLGKSTGRALKEFKEETRSLKDDKNSTPTDTATPAITQDQDPMRPSSPYQQPPQTQTPERDAEYRRDV